MHRMLRLQSAAHSAQQGLMNMPCITLMDAWGHVDTATKHRPALYITVTFAEEASLNHSFRDPEDMCFHITVCCYQSLLISLETQESWVKLR